MSSPAWVAGHTVGCSARCRRRVRTLRSHQRRRWARKDQGSCEKFAGALESYRQLEAPNHCMHCVIVCIEAQQWITCHYKFVFTFGVLDYYDQQISDESTTGPCLNQ